MLLYVIAHYFKLQQVNTGYYMLLNFTKSDYRLNSLLQVILKSFTGGALANLIKYYLPQLHIPVVGH